MRNSLSILTLAAASTLAGCSLIPAYEAPPLPVPNAYPAAAQADAAPVSMAWSDYFTDPRLQQLIRIALENNRDLRVAALNVEKARAQFQIERAAIFPSVGGVASANRGNSQVTGDLGNTFSAGVAISAWELDFFGRLRSLKEAALAQYFATDASRQASELALVSSVAQGWLTLIADEELLDISRRTLETREASAKLAQLSYEAGVTSALDLSQIESLAQAARATYAQQKRQRSLDESALTLLLGQPIPAEILASLTGSKLADIAPMADIPAGLPSDLLARRPDLRAAEQQLLAANANIGAARAAFFPSISLTAQYGSVSNELSNLFNSGTWGFNVGPTLNLPIFTGGRLTANLEASKATRAIAVAQYEKAIQTSFKEVSDALNSQSALAEQQAAQLAQTEAERRRLQLAELRYRNGVSSYLDLLDAQRSLFALEQADVQVRLAQRLNQINLYKALGGGWTQASLGKPQDHNH
ncbi:multidrug transporter [Comamonas kerstersii]|uniref:Multidrug transporter n=1 Tax=Comamonas kerstersii TaxID=225992 RepID=A0A1V0BCY0_9BURK|nr:efflux transporter outer membrane subunit [Comamonas kerstersii]AQZ97664.1 multidrug transporter [Comamonas kerstersii]